MPNASRTHTDLSISIDRYLSYLESERDAAGDMEIQAEQGTRERRTSGRIRKATGYYRSLSDERKRNDGKEHETIGGTKSMSTDLVRPGDISDAVDAQDLIDQFLAQNLDVIGDKRETRLRMDWVDRESRRIREEYEKRAREAYEKMWKECGKTNLGHSFARIDVQGYSVDQCTICTFVKGKAKVTQNKYTYSPETDDTPVRIAKDMNNDLIDAMARRMIELDEKAAILVWPMPEEMPQRELARRLKGKD